MFRKASLKITVQLLIIAALAVILSLAVYAVPANPFPQEVTQTSAPPITIYGKGDEFFSWTEDKDGYVIAYNDKTNNWCYAYISGNQILPGSEVVGSMFQTFGFTRPKITAQNLVPLIDDADTSIYSQEIQIEQPFQATQPRTNNNINNSPVNPRTNMTQNMLVILVEYADATLVKNMDYWYSHHFSTTGKTVNTYYDEVSGGKFKFQPISFIGTPTGTINTGLTTGVKEIELKNGVARVKLDKNHPGTEIATSTDPNEANAQINAILDKDISLAFDAIKKYIDLDSFPRYNLNNNCIKREDLHVSTVIAGYERSAGNEDKLQRVWAHAMTAWLQGDSSQTALSVVYSGGSYALWSYTTQGELYNDTIPMGVGVTAHELGHSLGLPDLYDTSDKSSGIGPYSLMANGSWGGTLTGTPGYIPTHLDAWSKIFLGFVTPSEIDATSYSQNDVYRFDQPNYNILKVYNPTNSDQYFLVENRGLSGYDEGLERYLSSGNTGGIMIYHIDETVYDGHYYDSNTETWTGDVNANYYHKMVDVEEAQGVSLDTKNISNADHFYELGKNTTFNNESTPNNSKFHNDSHGTSYPNPYSFTNCHSQSVASNIQIKINSTRGASMEVEVGKAPTITGVAADPTTLSATGGNSTITITGTDLADGITVTAFDGATATAITDTTTGDGTSQTATLTFLENTSTTADKVYTVKVSLDGGTNWETPTATVTVSKASVTPPSVTGIAANPTTLSAAGGNSTITITGTDLAGGITVTAFDNGTATTITGTTTGNPTSQTATLTFPTNASTTADKVYTVKVSLDGGTTWNETPTVTVKVSAASTYTLEFEGAIGTFDNLTYGYATGRSVTYTIKNTGNQEVTGITATITGGSDFVISTALSDNSLASGATAIVTVTSKTGLNASENPYTGVLTIAWSGNATSITQNLSQKVNKETLSDPTNLTFTDGMASWDTVTNATGYSVQLIKDEVSIGDAITVSSGTSYNFVSAITTEGSGVYTFSVTAIGDGNYEDSSAVTSTASYNNVKLTINPTSLTLGMYHTKTDTATVSIEPSSLTVTAYSWSVNPADGISLTNAGTATVTVTSTDTNEIASATLTVTVTIDGVNYTENITVKVIDDTLDFIAAPVITGIVVGNGTATVSWNPSNPAADSYTINYNGTSITSATSPYKVTGLTNGTEYTFTVTAVKTGYNNAPSSPLTATPYLKATGVSFNPFSSPIPINGTTTSPSALTIEPAGAGPITYNWTVSPSGAVTFNNSTVEQPTITGVLAGDCTITCTVTNTIDNSKVSHSQSLHILNNEAKILSFSLDGYTATINDSAGTISVTVPNTKVITALAATFTASSGATVEVNSTPQESGIIQNDFTTPVTYTVTAEDGTNPKTYVVTVEQSSALPLASPTIFSIDDNGVASWDSVTSSTEYIVQLYKDNIVYGSAVTVDANTTTYDFLAAMRTGGAGVYSIGVTAVGDGTININSPGAKDGSFTMYKIVSIAPLSSVDNIPVGTAKDSAGLPTIVIVTLNGGGGTKEISVTWDGYDSSSVGTVTLDGTLGTLPNNVLNPDNLLPSVEVTFVPLVNAATPVFTSNLSGSYNYSQNDAAIPLSVTASVTDSGNLSYQWYSNTTNNNTGGTLITGAIFENYTPSTATAGTMYYYVIVSNFNSAANGNKTETATSGVASVTVNPSVLPPNSHTITAYAGSGGTITPSGSVIVDDGNSQGFTISANANYAISDVKVDGVSVGSTSSYVFSNVTADHTIYATFYYIGGSTPPPVIPSVNPVNPTDPSTPSYTQSNSSSPSSSSTESSSTSTSTSETTTTIYINDQTVNAVITDEGVLKITYTADDVAKHQDKTGEYTISVPKQDNIDISVPVPSLGSDDLVIETEFGTITIPNETLKALQEIYGDTLRLSIVKGSFKITLLDSRGKEVRYNDSDNALTISLPYKRSGGQTSTIVAIKKNGDNTTVYPLGVYNDGYVTFDITSTGTYDVINNYKAFNDTSKHWAANYINFVTARELFNGTGNNNFTPDGTMTRAMFATVLARLDGAKISNSNSTYFTDIQKNQWYTGAVEWAAKNGILSDTTGEFRPNADITREEMSVMLYNYIKYKGYKLPKNAQNNGSFADENDISAWAAAAVKEIQRVGIINGRPGNIFDPKGTATRAEVATIFARFIEALNK